jgi:tight adherence protein B
MLSVAILLPMIFLLGVCCVGSFLVAALYPRLSAGADLRRRSDLIAPTRTAPPPRSDGAGENRRKRSVEATLRDADNKLKLKSKERAKPSLLTRMSQGNVGWSRRTYYLVCGVSGIAACFLVLSMGFGPLPALGFGISAGLMFPHWYVNFLRNRCFRRFAAEFPNAVDVIVRGIKTGLPLVDCLKIVAAETQDPVKGQFKTLLEDQAMGLPLDEAAQRLPERMPLPETNFFAIVIAIQSRTGGSLSEALANLSDVLRDRQKMKAKVRAMSGEAKSSAYIIGGLPIIVAGLLYVTSPQYIALLFTTQTGKFVLAACGLWMLCGISVMRKMINFEV